MAEGLSAEQVRDRHIRDMGRELGCVYSALMNDVTLLHAKWRQYKQLYAHSRERVALLNEVSGYFFGVVQRTLWENVLLSLARLTDPPKSVGKDNLTLERLPDLIGNPKLACELKGLVEAVHKACKSARTWRHRRLAHSDLGLALASSSDPLPGVTREEVEAALEAIRAALNRLAAHYWQSEMDYYPVIPHGGDGDSLVYFLDQGVRAEARQRKCLLEGKPLSENLEFSDGV